MARPFFSHSYQELEALFEEAGVTVETLKLLRAELAHRSTKKARNLLERVREKLNAATTPSTRKTKPVPPVDIDLWSRLEAKPEPLVTYPTADVESEATEPVTADQPEAAVGDLKIPDDLEMPRVFCRIRPPGTAGLPDPYVPELSQDVSLGVSKGADVLDVYIAAVSALVVEIKRTGAGQKRYELENGVHVVAPAGETLYSFSFADEAELFEDAQITVEIPGHRMDGSIVSIAAGKLLLSISGDLGPTVKRAVLLVDATALLEALRERLNQVKTGEITVNRSLSDAAVGRSAPPSPTAQVPVHSVIMGLNENQQKACEQALRASLTRIWGPPGTGKTTTLGSIVRSAFEADKRVLICSNTNKAVDQVLRQVCKALGRSHPALEEGRVVRVNKIADENLKNEYADYISVDGIAKRLSRELEERKVELEAVVRKIDARIARATEILEVFAKLEALQSHVRELQEKSEGVSRQLRKMESDLSSIDTRIANLNTELLKGKGVLFGLFTRSAERINRDIAQATGAREKQLHLVDETRGNLQATNQTYVTAQSARDQYIATAAKLDRNSAQQEINEAKKLRDSAVQELREVDSRIAELKSSIMRQAKVLGATCTKAYLSAKELGQFDLAIIDEASMVMPPMVWFAAGLSRERVVICGDPSQIPPIVPTSQQAVFDVLGHDVLEDHIRDPGTVMLNVQYRMDDAICRLISGPMYKGRLVSATEKPQSISVRLPEPFDMTCTVIDTSELWPFESVTAFRSRFNLMHALLARNLAWHLYRSGCIDTPRSLGICTPYAAQAKLTQKLLEDEDLQDRVQAGTVHRYQGDERGIVILDIPEGHGGGWSLGQFVQGVPPGHVGARLLNVAVTRAQSHLLVLANLTYLDRRLPSSSLLRSILHEMQQSGRVVPAKTLLELRPIESDLKGLVGRVVLDPEVEKFGIFDERSFDPAIRVDFASSKESIVIFSGFITPRRIGEYGDLFRAKLAEGVKIRCVTRPPHLNGSILPEDGKQALDSLEGIGCTVDCRSRIHQKAVIIDKETVWHGSLNALSHAHTTEESMTRIVSAGFAKELIASLAKRHMSANKASAEVTQAENPRCPNGHRTVYAEGRYGPYFYCENRHAENGCDWSSNLLKVERQDRHGQPGAQNTEPKKGPPCPKCGGCTVLRSSNWGTFYGCESYPRCNGVIRAKPQREGKGKRR